MSGKRFTLNLMKKPSEIEMYGKMISKYDVVRLLNELNDGNKQLQKENRELRQSVEYWQKKYEQGTETFQISENGTTFQFNSNQAQPYTIRSVSPNGVVRTGKKNSGVSYRMKDVREISQELPPFGDFNRETFMQMRNKFRKFDKDVLGRIIYNIYIGTFEEYI